METFIYVFFIVLGVYLVCMFAFGVVKYFLKRKDMKEKQKENGNNQVK